MRWSQTLIPTQKEAPADALIVSHRLMVRAGLIRQLAADTSLWSDDVWVVDSTPVECARSRDAARGSQLAGWAEYGYCASHSRYFWGLRLHLVCTPAGLPITWALAHPKLDERQVLMAVLDHDTPLLTARPGLLIIADKAMRRPNSTTTCATAASSCCARPIAIAHPAPASSCSPRSASSSSR